jgi:hypothetical protein
MVKQKNKNVAKTVIDVCMIIALLCLTAYQVTGEKLHEWIGIGMTVLVIVHQIINVKWYGGLFKGRYNPYRVAVTIVNSLLLVSLVLTALSGMSMSSYAVPFLYGMTPVSFARRVHLAISYWSFVLMGFHLGMHVRALVAKTKLRKAVRVAFLVVFCLTAGVGLWLFLKNKVYDYMLFRSAFAFFDYDKAGVTVFFENLMMLLFWMLAGHAVTKLLTSKGRVSL